MSQRTYLAHLHQNPHNNSVSVGGLSMPGDTALIFDLDQPFNLNVSSTWMFLRVMDGARSGSLAHSDP
jgi:hypothetical protein